MVLAYENTNLYLHEIFLHIEHHIATGPESVRREAENSSQRRINLLLSCVEATRSYLDCFLRTPPELVAKHSTLERGQLAHAVTVLLKLAFCTNLGLEKYPLRELCNVSYYVDALVGHLCSGSANLPDEGLADSSSAFKTMAERIKSWYDRTEFFEQEGTAADLKDMSPLQFVEIAKEEQVINFDFGNLDFSFLEAGNFWDQQ